MASKNSADEKRLKAIVEKFDKIYTNKPECDKCKSRENVIPCAYGKPSQELLEYAQTGRLKLMGCMVPQKRAIAHCKSCNNDLFA